MLDVDDYLKVRYAVQIEGLSKRAAARRGCSSEWDKFVSKQTQG